MRSVLFVLLFALLSYAYEVSITDTGKSLSLVQLSILIPPSQTMSAKYAVGCGEASQRISMVSDTLIPGPYCLEITGL